MELLRRYSNHHGLVTPLVSLLRRVYAGDQSGPLAVQSVPPSPRWLDSRLEAGDRERMAEQYMAGATAAALAERYGISVKSVKRTLQERGARKRAEPRCNPGRSRRLVRMRHVWWTFWRPWRTPVTRSNACWRWRTTGGTTEGVMPTAPDIHPAAVIGHQARTPRPRLGGRPTSPDGTPQLCMKLGLYVAHTEIIRCRLSVH